MKIYGLTAKELCSMNTQFLIPFYQRDYSWIEPDCITLLNDILKKVKDSNISHFMGSICIQNTNDGYVLVDGQQRLITLMLFLLSIRDLSNDHNTREILTNEYLLNENKNSKVLLKSKDAIVFEKLIFQEDDIFAINNITEEDEQTLIYQNYNLFYNKIYEFLSKYRQYNLYNFMDVLNVLNFAVIELEDENPQVVFESLNTTGKSLTELDKIKNYTLMSFPQSKQKEVYEKYWMNMKENVGEDLQEFIVSYLIIQNKSDFVEDIYEKISDKTLYEAFKSLSYERGIIETLEGLLDFTKYYKKLKERDGASYTIFNILKSSSALTFCMYLFEKEMEFQESLEEAFELYLSYILRSKVCERSNIKNSHAGYLISMTNMAKNKESFILLLTSAFLQSSGIYKFPSNKEFKEALINNDIYLSLGPTGTKYLLHEIEKAEMFRQNKLPSIEEGTIEHIMPQTLTQEWEELLKNDRYCYSQNLHTLGNLAITLFNSELSNKPFEDKCEIYKTDPYYYTREIARNDKWGSISIKRRAEELAGIALNIWKGLNSENHGYEKIAYTIYDDIDLFVGRKPNMASILNEEREVKSWNDLCYFIYSTLYELDEITMLRFLYNEKNDLLGDTPMGTGSRKITDGLYLTMNGGVKKILTNIRNLVEFYDKKSDMTISDKFWFTIR